MLGQHTLKSQAGSRKKNVKRLGRGNGSGSGNFSGRGMNGQNQRAGKKIKAWFEGGQTPMVRRLPILRGFNNPNHVSYQVINLTKLANHFKAGETVTPELLKAKGLIAKLSMPVKLLSQGELTYSLQVHVHGASKAAIEKVEKAGGKVEIQAQ